MTVENAVILLVLDGSKSCLRFAGEPVTMTSSRYAAL